MRVMVWALRLPNGGFATRSSTFNDGLPTALFKTKRHAVAASKDMFGTAMLSVPVKVFVTINEVGGA